MATFEFTHSWKAAELDRCMRRNVVSGASGLGLRRGVTIADESGRTDTRNIETVKGLRQARKRFQLPTAPATETALLCPYLRRVSEGGQLQITVNGESVPFELAAQRDYWEDAWQRIEVPARLLRQGENEVVFRAVGDSQWSLLIEESRHPDRSEISDDGGITWRSEELGGSDRADGEYVVRLWLDQYANWGEIISDPVDLLAASGEVATTHGGSAVARLDVEWSTPECTGIEFSW
ncbi:uncharacterized protein METZ01_LOCUS436509, partial [marine metagenome]